MGDQLLVFANHMTNFIRAFALPGWAVLGTMPNGDVAKGYVPPPALLENLRLPLLLAVAALEARWPHLALVLPGFLLAFGKVWPLLCAAWPKTVRRLRCRRWQ